jgi:dipeptidyl aminopeptidase/acylaminoacyl peptidase
VCVATASTAVDDEAEVRAAYARAALFTNVAGLNKCLNTGEASPHWTGDGHVWWLRRWTTAAGAPAKQFMVVSLDGLHEPAPAFDHSLLAAGLVQAGLVNHQPASSALPFSALGELGLSGDAPHVTFTLNGQRVRCDLLAYTCELWPEQHRSIDGVPSPNGKYVAFVRQYNLWLRDVVTGEETALSHDGREGYAYATPLPDPVAMVSQLTDKPVHMPLLQWSPDSSKIATFALTVPAETQLLGMAQNAPPDRYRPRHYVYPYPLPVDEQLPSSTPKIFDVETCGQLVSAGRPSSSETQSLPGGYGGAGYGGISWQWAGDSASVRFTEIDRGYTACRLVEIDLSTGHMRTVVEERDDISVNNFSGGNYGSYREMDDILWLSERDGHHHLYLYANDGSLKHQLTHGEWQVRNVHRVDSVNRCVYFSGSGREPDRDPYLRHLYCVGMDDCALQLLTPEPAEHTVTFSPDGTVFVDAYGTADCPAQTLLRSAVDGSLLCVMENADVSALTKMAPGWRPPTPFQGTAADGVTPLFALIWWPSNYDPNKRYPVVENIYTGPHAAHVPKGFKQSLFHHSQAIAELGFVCVFIDGRGSGDRSREFRLRSQKNLKDGGGGPDHVEMLRQMAVQHPSMDLDRVGIWGHSAGGYDSARAIFDHPDFYKVAVSTAGCHDNRMDKASWNEQWMGRMGPHYEENSNYTAAHKLKGKLLLAHGEVDENVPIAATLKLVEALMQANKDFDYFPLANQDHSLGRRGAGPQGAWAGANRYLLRRRYDYFVRHLLGVEPPSDHELPEEDIEEDGQYE